MATLKQPDLLQAAKWTIGSNVLQEALAGGLTFILASFLKPSEFGIAAMGYIYVTFIEVIVGFGFSSAIIQRHDIKNEHLDSVFWLNQLTGVLFALVAILLSGWWSRINSLPTLQPMLIVISVVIPINSLSIVQIAILQRKMDFKSLAIRDNAATLCGGAIGLGFAVSGYGAWALVWQYVTRSIISFVLVWKLSDWRPTFSYRMSAIMQLSKYAAKTFSGQIGNFVQQQSDSIVIALLIGPVGVGLYRLANRLVELNLKFLPRALQIVALPHFSRLQKDLPELNKSVLLAVHLNCIVTLPIMAYLMGAGSLLLRLLGEQWSPATGVLQILCLIGASKSVILMIGPLLQATSRPGVSSMSTWVLALGNVAVTCLAAFVYAHASPQRQILMIAGARMLLFVGVFTPLMLWQAKQATGLRLLSVLLVMRSSLYTCLVVGVTQWGLINYIIPYHFFNRYISVFFSITIAVATWLLSVWIFDLVVWQYANRAASSLKNRCKSALLAVC